MFKYVQKVVVVIPHFFSQIGYRYFNNSDTPTLNGFIVGASQGDKMSWKTIGY